MTWSSLIHWCCRRKARHAKEAAAAERDTRAREQISQLQHRKAAVEGYLVPRQRRNHWQEAVASMIHSGRP